MYFCRHITKYIGIMNEWLLYNSNLTCLFHLSTITERQKLSFLSSLAQYSLKVSKSRKQNTKLSHTPKNQRNFSHFSALASKKSWKIVQTQDESTKILIWCYLTQWNSFIALIRPLLKARAKNVKNFVGFLGNEKTRLFAFEIYWPLVLNVSKNSHFSDPS